MSIYIATNIRYISSIKALILLSPLSSLVKLSTIDSINNSNKSSELESSYSNDERVLFYDQVNKIKIVCCPVMIIHGLKDEIIPYSKTLELVKLLTCDWSAEWYPTNGGHKNIINKYRVRFYLKVSNFLKHTNLYNQNNRSVMDRFSNSTYNNKYSVFDDDIITIRKSVRRSPAKKINNTNPSGFRKVQLKPCPKTSSKTQAFSSKILPKEFFDPVNDLTPIIGVLGVSEKVISEFKLSDKKIKEESGNLIRVDYNVDNSYYSNEKKRKDTNFGDFSAGIAEEEYKLVRGTNNS